MIFSLQCVFQFLLLTIIITYLYVTSLSLKFVSLGDSLFSEFVLEVLLDVFGVVPNQGSITLPFLYLKIWFKFNMVGNHLGL